jgi:hypothetical protein
MDAIYIYIYTYNPEDSSEHHTRRRENLKSQKGNAFAAKCCKIIPWTAAGK